MQEEWRDVVGYEGCYQVSNFGSVKNIKRKVKSGNGIRIAEEKIINQRKNKYGYLIVCLSINQNKKTLTVHRLVANAFIKNENNYPCINHKDENKINNSVENLEWCTVKYNNGYGSKRIKVSIEKSKSVIQLLNGIEIARYSSSVEACKCLKRKSLHIGDCCNGNRKSAGGYQWKFAR